MPLGPESSKGYYLTVEPHNNKCRRFTLHSHRRWSFYTPSRQVRPKTGKFQSGLRSHKFLGHA